MRVIAAATLCLTAPGSALAQELPVGDSAALGFDAARLERVGTLIQHLVNTDTIAGAVLMVARDGRVVFSGAYGLADRERKVPMRLDNIFRLASATKIWISTVALMLYEDGAFAMDTPVTEFVPEFASLEVRKGDGAIASAEKQATMRDLFRHTCGYGYGFGGAQQAAYREAGILTRGPTLDWTHDWSLAEWAQHLATVPLAAEPGASFDYGLCHDILGLALEKVARQPLDELLEARVLRPLGLNSTGFWFDDQRARRLANVYEVSNGTLRLVDDANSTRFRRKPGALSGGGGWDSPVGYGGLASSAPDFLRLLQALLDGGELDGVRILGRKTTELFFRNHLTGLDSEDSYWPGVGFGLGTAVLYDPGRFGDIGSAGTIWWAGSNGAYFWVDPVERVVGVYMTQARPFDVGGTMDRVRRAVMTSLVAR